MSKSDKQKSNSHPSDDKPWLFKPGQSGNPSGRPPGTKSLKTYAAEYLKSLTDIEKMEFLAGLPKEIVWKMAEGNPKQDNEISGGLTISQVLDQLDGSTTQE